MQVHTASPQFQSGLATGAGMSSSVFTNTSDGSSVQGVPADSFHRSSVNDGEAYFKDLHTYHLHQYEPFGRVFPINLNKKPKVCSIMQDSAHPRDLWTIQKWTQRPATSGLNLLIENRACVVLDCESAEKGGVDGIEELARICDELGFDLPDCPITR